MTEELITNLKNELHQIDRILRRRQIMQRINRLQQRVEIAQWGIENFDVFLRYVNFINRSKQLHSANAYIIQLDILNESYNDLQYRMRKKLENVTNDSNRIQIIRGFETRLTSLMIKKEELTNNINRYSSTGQTEFVPLDDIPCDIGLFWSELETGNHDEALLAPDYWHDEILKSERIIGELRQLLEEIDYDTSDQR